MCKLPHRQEAESLNGSRTRVEGGANNYRLCIRALSNTGGAENQAYWYLLNYYYYFAKSTL